MSNRQQINKKPNNPNKLNKLNTPKRRIILTNKEASDGLKGDKLWVCSHGGVGSEYLTEQLNIKYKRTPLDSHYEFGSVIVHYHQPVLSGPKKAIFLYGDLYNSIYSQIRRHPMNPQKFANDNYYPLIKSVQDMFQLSRRTKDPYMIFNMFQNFMVGPTTYPLFMMKYNPPKDVIKRLHTFTGREFDYKFKSRSSDFIKDHGLEKIRKMEKIYGELNWIMNEMPNLIIRFPANMDFKMTNENITTQIEKITDTDTDILSSTSIPHTAKQNKFTFQGEDYIIYQSFEDVILLLHNVTKNKTIELKTSRGNIENTGGFTVCKFFKQIYILLNFTPLIAVKINNLETGSCEFCTKVNKLPEKTDIVNATPLQMWNHPNYVGFYVNQEMKVQSFAFNAIKQKVHIKDIDFTLVSDKPEEESFVSLKVDGTNIITKTHNHETICTYNFNFDAFCKHFNLLG